MNPARVMALVVADELSRCGVTHVCLAPGSRSTPLAGALFEQRDIETHVVVDERSAAFIAVGIGKATGHPAVVLSTSGTAAANFYPAVVEAAHARVPLLVLTADRPPELRATGANQTIDQIKMYGDAVRWFCEVGAPRPGDLQIPYWRSVAGRGVAAATGSPAGPVHLNCAFAEPLVGDGDEGAIDLGGRAGGAPWCSIDRSNATASPETESLLGGKVGSVERGLIVAGDRPIEPEPAIRLARAASWPVLAEAPSGLRCSELAISAYDALLRHRRWAEAHRPDFVIRIGKTGTSKALARLLDSSVEQVLIDPDALWLDPDRTIGRVVPAPPEQLLGVLAATTGREGSPWLDSWLAGEGAARKAIDEVLDGEEAVTEPRVARDLARALPEGTTLVVASSMPIRDVDWFMARRTGLRVLANRGASGIDGFVSTAAGVSLTANQPVAALAGDLSILHDISGLAAVPRIKAACVFVVVNNDGGGIFSFLPQAPDADRRQFEALYGTPHGTDFSAVAKAFGCRHSLIDSAGELGPRVAEAFEAGGVWMLEARTDRAANVEFHERIWDAVAESLQA